MPYFQENKKRTLMKEAKTKQAAQEDRMPRREQTHSLMKTYIIFKKKTTGKPCVSAVE